MSNIQKFIEVRREKLAISNLGLGKTDCRTLLEAVRDFPLNCDCRPDSGGTLCNVCLWKEKYEAKFGELLND